MGPLKEKAKQAEADKQDEAIEEVALEEEAEECDCCGNPVRPNKNSSDCLDSD